MSVTVTVDVAFGHLTERGLAGLPLKSVRLLFSIILSLEGSYYNWISGIAYFASLRVKCLCKSFQILHASLKDLLWSLILTSILYVFTFVYNF